MRVPISPHPHQHLLLSIFLIIDILVSSKWYLTVVLICISLTPNDVEHLFMSLLVISISSLESVHSDPLSILKIRLFVFLLLTFKYLYIFQIQVPDHIYDLQVFFSHSVDCLFTTVDL